MIRGYCIYNTELMAYIGINISNDEILSSNRTYTIFNSLFDILNGSGTDEHLIADMYNNYIILEVECDNPKKFEINDIYSYYKTRNDSKIINTISYDEYVDYITNNEDLILKYYIPYVQSIVIPYKNNLSIYLIRSYSTLYKMGLFRELILDVANQYNNKKLLKNISLVDSFEKTRKE